MHVRQQYNIFVPYSITRYDENISRLTTSSSYITRPSLLNANKPKHRYSCSLCLVSV